MQDNAQYYPIGEVSRISGISKDTLHFYQKIGLLQADYTDPENGYRYYSRWNLWQLDIITTCRKLRIPLEKIRRILALRDNEKIVALLMDYREEALRLSRYYRQVADDIVWYGEENERLRHPGDGAAIAEEYLDAETVLVGSPRRGAGAYHADLQEAAKTALRRAPSIRKRYGYVLDAGQLQAGKFVKMREYLKLEGSACAEGEPENRLTLPAGRYAVFTLRIRNETADFSPLLAWLAARRQTADAVYAEEVGLQLFEYLDDYYCTVKAHLADQ